MHISIQSSPSPLLPLTYRQYTEFDVLASSDGLYSPVFSEQLEQTENFHRRPNPGIALFRPSAESLVFSWLDCVLRGLDSDRACLAAQVQQDLKRIETFPEPAVLCVGVGSCCLHTRCRHLNTVKLTPLAPDAPARRAHYDSVVLGALPTNLFVGGQMWLEGYHQRDNASDVFAQHASGQSCAEAKKHRMREDGRWLMDGERHFDNMVGFIAYDPDIPLELLETVQTFVRVGRILLMILANAYTASPPTPLLFTDARTALSRAGRPHGRVDADAAGGLRRGLDLPAAGGQAAAPLPGQPPAAPAAQPDGAGRGAGQRRRHPAALCLRPRQERVRPGRPRARLPHADPLSLPRRHDPRLSSVRLGQKREGEL